MILVDHTTAHTEECWKNIYTQYTFIKLCSLLHLLHKIADDFLYYFIIYYFPVINCNHSDIGVLYHVKFIKLKHQIKDL